MTRAFGVVDLFSGPGGLGEGFSAFKASDNSRPFRLEISVEKDRAAHETLRLRSFLRKFPDDFPDEYYCWLNGELPAEPDWQALYPESWSAAEREARRLELGTDEARLEIDAEIQRVQGKYAGSTVLIGGPPCQAYSLAGRSRNAGNAKYEPSADDRHFLYREYVYVLKALRPAIFVMENVKGLLSSSVDGDRIFNRIMKDLRNAGGNDEYQLVALSPNNVEERSDATPKPQDFILRSEQHGVPQRRHRLIVIGIRRDVAEERTQFAVPRLTRCKAEVTVRQVLGGISPLRSGLSRNDSPQAWQEAVVSACSRVRKSAHSNFPSEAVEVRDVIELVSRVEHGLQPIADSGRAGPVPPVMPSSCPMLLSRWLTNKRLKRLINHDTRGHMADDLARYLFAASFGVTMKRSPKAREFPIELAPLHKNWTSGKFADRFRVQCWDRSATTITSHISKDGHYFIHPDPRQVRSLTVREAARLQTFPDDYFFKGNRTEQYVQVGNAVPPYLAYQIAACIWESLGADYDGAQRSPLAERAFG